MTVDTAGAPGTDAERSFAERLCAATNSHDVERLVTCFADDYVNETPAHPDRSFQGRDQVRRNWTQIFAAVPDIEAELLHNDPVGDHVWTEWEMRGTRKDGAPHLMRGVILFTVVDGLAARVRFYLEPVDATGPDADGAVQEILARRQP